MTLECFHNWETFLLILHETHFKCRCHVGEVGDSSADNQHFTYTITNEMCTIHWRINCVHINCVCVFSQIFHLSFSFRLVDYNSSRLTVFNYCCKQESPAVADKPMQRESMPKRLPLRTNSKSYARFQLVQKSTTLDDPKRDSRSVMP